MRQDSVFDQLQQQYNSNTKQFIQQPLQYINNVVTANNTSADAVHTSLHKLVLQHNNDIPVLNIQSFSQYSNNQLVQYQCMIQDIYNPEFYLSQYNLHNTQTNTTTQQSCLYIDTVHLPEYCTVDIHDRNNVQCERMSMNCIPVPGQSEWTKLQPTHTNSTTASAPSNTSTKKRTADSITTDNDTVDVTSSADKRIRNEVEEQKTNDTDLQQTTELQQPSIIVTLYDNNYTQYKVTDIITVIGILSLDTSEYSIHNTNDTMNIDNEYYNHPQHNTQPIRIHAISCIRTADTVPSDIQIVQRVNELKQHSNVREQIIQYLSDVLGGDLYAAELLLLSLISHVVSRKDQLVGTLALNLCVNVDMTHEQTSLFVRQLNHAISLLLPRVVKYDITIHTLNTLQWQPRKDYTTDRLQYGLLQIPYCTVLLLDETQINTGTLNSNGVKHMNVLNQLITQQLIEYDYQYNTLQFYSDCSVITVSKGKSLLPCDIRVHINATKSFTVPTVDDSTLTVWRQYIDTARYMKFELNESAAEPIEQYLVHIRQQNQKLTEDELHRYVNLVRLYCNSRLENTLSIELWYHVKLLLDQVYTKQYNIIQ